MSDYNDGLLPEPCLRMDTHFGDEYESVEFGDGTGYVKAELTLARLGAIHVELDELRDENAKLREELDELRDENAKLRELVDGLTWCCDNYGCRQECPLYDVSEPDHCREVSIKHELGIEVDE